MKRIIVITLLATAFAGCSSSKHSTASQGTTLTPANPSADGSSYDKAVLIQQTTETAGVNAEYAWIRNNYPGSKTGNQSLMMHNKKPYDVLIITTADGTQKTVYFDISNFFGKL